MLLPFLPPYTHTCIVCMDRQSDDIRTLLHWRSFNLTQITRTNKANQISLSFFNITPEWIELRPSSILLSASKMSFHLTALRRKFPHFNLQECLSKHLGPTVTAFSHPTQVRKANEIKQPPTKSLGISHSLYQHLIVGTQNQELAFCNSMLVIKILSKMQQIYLSYQKFQASLPLDGSVSFLHSYNCDCHKQRMNW